ncbi:MAG: hypothetical protein RSE91_02915 [Bacilli bacterium]
MKKNIFDVEPYTFTGSAIIIGILLTKELANNEQDSVGNWLQLVGQILQTYSSKASIILDDNKEKETTNMISSLKKTLKKMQESIDNLEK